MHSIWVCFAGPFFIFDVIRIGIEVTGKGPFPAERTFPSETNTFSIDGERDSRRCTSRISHLFVSDSLTHCHEFPRFDSRVTGRFRRR